MHTKNPHLQAVHIIPHKRVSRMGHVYPDLVGAPSHWPAAHQAAAHSLHPFRRICCSWAPVVRQLLWTDVTDCQHL